jgi:Ala-tRNA(Pro) deacylase
MIVADYLRERDVVFQVIPHPETHSAQRLAHEIHISGDNVAKCVAIKVDSEFAVLVLQATHVIDLEQLREHLSAGQVRLAVEEEFRELFRDTAPGNVPPFGSMYGLKTYVDRALTSDPLIIFAGNTDEEAIQIRYDDFAALEHPTVLEFTRHE